MPPLCCRFRPARTSGRRGGDRRHRARAARSSPRRPVARSALQRREHGRHRGRAVLGPGAQESAVDAEPAQARQALEGREGVAVARLDQLDLDGVAAQLALELLRRPLGDNTPAVDDREPRSEAVGLLEVVRRQQDRHLLLAREPLDLVPELGAGLRVQPGGRLVEEEHLRPVDEPERDVEPALHAARVRLGEPVAGPGQADLVQDLLDALAPSGADDPVDLGLHLEVLAAGRLRVEAGLLPDDPDRTAYAARVPDDVESGHARLAAVWTGERGQDLHGRRLAGAVRAEQTEDRSRLDREAKPVERGDVALVRLPQVRCFDRIHCSSDPSYSSTVERF